MRGLMMDRPLLISSLIEYGAEVHATSQIVSRRVEGDIHRYSFVEARSRIARLAQGLLELGVRPGDRVATIAWNGYRHFELYYAISGIGAVCHTINPRLFPEQIVYVLNHAADRILFTDLTFVPLVEKIAPAVDALETVVLMADDGPAAEAGLEGAAGYETLLKDSADGFKWPEFDENTAAGLCYTSGTTGNPKGVLYSHRSNVLHALAALAAGEVHLTQHDRVLPVVPLFHVNAWGLPYAVPLTGSTLVFPGPGLDGASLFDLMDAEGVTSAWGVPTIWFGLLAEMDKRGAKPGALEAVVVGGAAPPRAMIERFEHNYGLDVCHGWGMTEMSPIGSLCLLRPDMDALSPEQKIDVKTRQGRRLFGVEMKIVGDDGENLPHDGVAFGELHVRGPFITSGYYEDEIANETAFDDHGWFRTGDVAKIDPDGYMAIVDRTKDMIKSGGEWISSIDLENAAAGHPDLLEAAVIARPHPKWGERPLLVAVSREGVTLAPDDVRAFLEDKVASWWIPDDVVFVAELPHTATGKVRKSTLRQQFKDYVLPGAGD